MRISIVRRDNARLWDVRKAGIVWLVLHSTACILLAAEEPSAGPVVINEVMASNATVLADPQGDFDDWVELYNAGPAVVDLGGMYLTDDPAEPRKWQIPADRPSPARVNPGGYLIIWIDGDTGDPGLHASFRLDADGDELHLFDIDGETWVDGFAFGKQTSDVSYGRYPDGAETLRFFGEPTPGRPNNEGYLGEVAPLRFSHERGFYTVPFDLTITTATPGAEILYTIDGKAPDALGYRVPPGRPYAGPLHIGRTVCLRVMATKPGWKPTPICTQTYAFDGRPEVRSLPMISLVGDEGKTFYEPDGVMAIVGGTYSGGVWSPSGAGSYNNILNRGLERPVSAEWLPWDDDGSFQADCGLRVHGSPWIRPRYTRQNGYWTGDGKISLRLYFRGAYGQSRLEYPLFPESDVEEFATLVLRSGHNDRTNPFIKDELLRRLHKDMGQRACMGTFANLFINGEYKGYFNPTEHVKEESCQKWFDSDEPWDVMTMNGIRDGDSRSWDTMLSYARTRNLADPMAYAELGTMLDVVSFIDYLIIRLWPNDWDWPQNNWSAACERSAAGRWKFFVWDAEGTFVPSQLSVDRFGELNSQGNPNGYLYRALKANKDFRLLFADRLYKHFYNGGALTQENISRRFYEMREELRGVIPNMDTYVVNGWAPSRLGIFLSACTREGLYTFAGPALAVNGTPQHGGRVNAGDRLQLNSSRAGGTIYCTLDGTDPALSAAPPPPTTVTLVSRESAKRVLVPTGPQANDWRGGRTFDDSAWTLSTGAPGGVGYERSTGYQSHISVDVGPLMYAVNGSCYVRVPFVLEEDRNALATLTLRMQYDDGFIAYLNGTEVARRNFTGEPAWDSVANASHDDGAAVLFEHVGVSEHIAKLRQGGNILAIHGLNAGTTSSDFLITAELLAGREVPDVPPTSLQAYTAPIPLTKSTRVKARVQSGGVWSALAEATFAVGPVAESLRISELMYHPAGDPNTEYIELTNIGGQAVNLNLVRFTDGIDFEFPDTSLAPGGLCLIVRDRTAFEARYGPDLPVVGQYAGSLNDDGERVELQDAAGSIIHRFEYRDNWFRNTDGAGFSLTVSSPQTAAVNTWNHRSAWRPSVLPDGSPGVEDGDGIEPAAVVINELLANSAGGEPDWIELYNTTERAIDIGGWFLSDDGDDLTRYQIAAGTTIRSRSYMTLREDQHFGNSNDPGCRVPFGLSRTGETVYLCSGAAGVVTGYHERAEFGASDPGVSLGRLENGTGGFDLVPLTEPTPGGPNADPVTGPVVITEIMYHTDGSADVEYVELQNIGDTEVVLYDHDRGAPWRFTDGPDGAGIDLMLPQDPPVSLASHGYLLLVKDRVLFESRFAAPAFAQVLEWGAGKLSNAGEVLQLSRPGDLGDDGLRVWIRVDRVAYSDGAQHDDFPTGLDLWPTEADGRGLSLTRIDPGSYGNTPANWNAVIPSPGVARQRPNR